MAGCASASMLEKSKEADLKSPGQETEWVRTPLQAGAHPEV